MIGRFDGLFKTYSINKGYVTVSEKEIDDVVKQLNELQNKYVDESEYIVEAK